MVGLAAIVTQIPLVDEFRWSGWYLAFHGTIQMLIVLVVFKENWSDLKRASVKCKRLSILSGIAVPFYVSFEYFAYVTGPAKIDHVSANYTELYFR